MSARADDAGDGGGRDIFHHIYGQQHVKVTLRGALRSEEGPHVLLVGPPGSGKSEFLHALEESLPSVRYLDGDAVTQGQLKDVLAENHPIIVLDEFDELDAEAYRALSVPLESGRAVKENARTSYDVDIKTQVIAACNDTSRVPGHILSRFNEVELEPYDEDEFLDVCRYMLPRSVGWVETGEQAERVARAALEVEGETDPRVARNLANMCGSPDELDDVVAAMKDPNADVADVSLRPEDVARTRDEVMSKKLTETLTCEVLTPGECVEYDGGGDGARRREEAEIEADIEAAVEDAIEV